MTDQERDELRLTLSEWQGTVVDGLSPRAFSLIRNALHALLADSAELSALRERLYELRAKWNSMGAIPGGYADELAAILDAKE